jgi:hypothetical protein
MWRQIVATQPVDAAVNLFHCTVEPPVIDDSLPKCRVQSCIEVQQVELLLRREFKTYPKAANACKLDFKNLVCGCRETTEYRREITDSGGWPITKGQVGYGRYVWNAASNETRNFVAVWFSYAITCLHFCRETWWLRTDVNPYNTKID